MNMPGLTASAAIFKTSGRYRTTNGCGEIPGNSMPGTGAVQAQRVMSPYGPIGLPGQNLCGVCWHMCMTFGGGNYTRCALECAGCDGSAGFGFGFER